MSRNKSLPVPYPRRAFRLFLALLVEIWSWEKHCQFQYLCRQRTGLLPAWASLPPCCGPCGLQFILAHLAQGVWWVHGRRREGSQEHGYNTQKADSETRICMQEVWELGNAFRNHTCEGVKEAG